MVKTPAHEILQTSQSFHDKDAYGYKGTPYVHLPSYDAITEWNRGLTITVVMSNFFRSHLLFAAIGSVAIQPFPKNLYEIIVIDDDSDLEGCKQTVALMLEHWPDLNIRLFETHQRTTYNLVKACNIGFKRAKGEVIVIQPSDTLLFGNYLLAVQKHHSVNDNIALCGVDVGTATRLCLDVGMSIKTKTWHAIKGMDERTRGGGGGDVNYFLRLSWAGVKFFTDHKMFLCHYAAREQAYTDKLTVADKFISGTKDEKGLTHNDRMYWDIINNKKMIVNDETWGELNTLEEIKVK